RRGRPAALALIPARTAIGRPRLLAGHRRSDLSRRGLAGLGLRRQAVTPGDARLGGDGPPRPVHGLRRGHRGPVGGAPAGPRGERGRRRADAARDVGPPVRAAVRGSDPPGTPRRAGARPLLLGPPTGRGRGPGWLVHPAVTAALARQRIVSGLSPRRGS